MSFAPRETRTRNFDSRVIDLSSIRRFRSGLPALPRLRIEITKVGRVDFSRDVFEHAGGAPVNYFPGHVR